MIDNSSASPNCPDAQPTSDIQAANSSESAPTTQVGVSAQTPHTAENLASAQQLTAQDQPAQHPVVPRAAAQPRIATLDALRGFALCGIIFANASPVLGLFPLLPEGGMNPVAEWVARWVQGHFFPIFSLLFGVGFGIMWLSAQQRSARPRLVMLRRLGFLTLLGVGHTLLHPGEALIYYGLLGLVFLLPATFIPLKVRPWVLGVVWVPALLVGAWHGGPALIPGLFLLGFWVGEAGLVRQLLRPLPGLLLAVLGGAATAVALMVNGFPPTVQSGWDAIYMTGGTALYLGLFILLASTPLRGAITWLLSPLGKTALTNYITATLLLLLVKWLLLSTAVVPVDTAQGWLTVMFLWAGILVLQRVVSGVWVRLLAQGPLEWVWRKVTWLSSRETPFRRRTA